MRPRLSHCPRCAELHLRLSLHWQVPAVYGGPHGHAHARLSAHGDAGTWHAGGTGGQGAARHQGDGRGEEAGRGGSTRKAAPQGGWWPQALGSNLFKGAKRDGLFAELDRAIDDGDLKQAAEIKKRIDAPCER